MIRRPPNRAETNGKTLQKNLTVLRDDLTASEPFKNKQESLGTDLTDLGDNLVASKPFENKWKVARE